MRQLIQHIPHTFSASFLLALSPFLVFYRPTQPCACWTVPIFRTKLVIPSQLWCHFEGKFLSAIGPGDKFQSQLPLKIKIEENRKLRQRKCSRSCFCTLTKTTNSLLTPFSAYRVMAIQVIETSFGNIYFQCKLMQWLRFSVSQKRFLNFLKLCFAELQVYKD